MNNGIKNKREEVIKKYSTTIGGKVIIGLVLIMAGGPMFLIGFFLTPFLIGFPLLIVGFSMEILGVLMFVIAIAQAVLSPFRKFKVVKS